MPFEYSLNQNNDAIRNGDIRVVDLPVNVFFEWSDKIIAEYDHETNEVIKYTSGWVMKVIPGQEFVYKNQPTVYLGQATIEPR